VFVPDFAERIPPNAPLPVAPRQPHGSITRRSLLAQATHMRYDEDGKTKQGSVGQRDENRCPVETVDAPLRRRSADARGQKER